MSSVASLSKSVDATKAVLSNVVVLLNKKISTQFNVVVGSIASTLAEIKQAITNLWSIFVSVIGTEIQDEEVTIVDDVRTVDIEGTARVIINL